MVNNELTIDDIVELTKGKINAYKRMASVDRMAGRLKIRNYSLAYHQYYTTLLFMHFAELEKVEYNMDVLKIIMKHDFLEAFTNDLPWPIKNLNEKTKECWEKIEHETAKEFPELALYTDDVMKEVMTEQQFYLFKMCDYLELWLFMKEEMLMGNHVEGIVFVENKCRELILKISDEKYKFYSVLVFMREYNSNLL